MTDAKYAYPCQVAKAWQVFVVWFVVPIERVSQTWNQTKGDAVGLERPEIGPKGLQTVRF